MCCFRQVDNLLNFILLGQSIYIIVVILNFQLRISPIFIDFFEFLRGFDRLVLSLAIRLGQSKNANNSIIFKNIDSFRPFKIMTNQNDQFGLINEMVYEKMFFYELQNDIISKMKKAFTSKRFHLPHIKSTQKYSIHEDKDTELSEAQQVSCLDQWNSQNSQPSRHSKLIRVLYKETMGRKTSKRQLTQSSLVIEARLFLMRLESELKKAQDINYTTIYKNIQFCSGIYENAYGCLLRQIQKLKEALTSKYQQLEESLQRERMQHIQHMQRLEEKENYRNKIPIVRKNIEDKEAELEPIKNAIEDLQKARVTVLKKCLSQGYDVRQEGLLWIMKELKGDFNKEDFPKFLNEKQIQFLEAKFKNEQVVEEDQSLRETLLTVAPEKSSGEIIDIVTRKNKREFTMAHDAKILEQLRNKQTAKLNSERHHLISNEVLRMAKEELALTKATKYELIYKETIKKLNKFCSDQIHNKQRNSNTIQGRRQSAVTLKLISCFDAKVEDYLKGSTCNSHHANTQQIAFEQILRSLRYQSFHLGDREPPRNPISVIACLVGWKKAKKLVQNQLNSLV